MASEAYLRRVFYALLYFDPCPSADARKSGSAKYSIPRKIRIGNNHLFTAQAVTSVRWAEICHRGSSIRTPLPCLEAWALTANRPPEDFCTGVTREPCFEPLFGIVRIPSQFDPRRDSNFSDLMYISKLSRLQYWRSVSKLTIHSTLFPYAGKIKC